MTMLKFATNRSKKLMARSSQEEKWDLIEDIDDAFQKWEQAQLQFNMAQGQDEVDYSIFMLEAAEKRLTMLLRRAKHTKLRAHYYVKVQG
ncbi:MAG: DUF2508 family protein [Paenibacillus sp.]|nr:DUF2508 family protein [Paenibacillus sp.]